MRDFDVMGWEAFFGQVLGVDCLLGAADEDIPAQELSSAEIVLEETLGTAHRRAEWRRGRSALKNVLRRLGEDLDTSRIEFPHRRYSISHSARLAVAIGMVEAAPARGIGIDVELARTPPLQSARFFLTPRESGWLDTLPEGARAAALRRLWTEKEALYKADPGNLSRILTDYHLADPQATVGSAEALGKRFSYASLEIPGGILSVAVLRTDR